MGLEKIVEKVVSVIKNDEEIEVTDNGISVKSENSMVTRIVKKNESKRIVSGPVLVPDEADHSGDIVSKEEIEEKAHTYLRKYGNVDKQHQLANKAEVVESYITPTKLTYKLDGEEVVIPEGSWWLSVKVTDDETWKQVEDEELNGFSIMAVNKDQSSEKSSLDTAKKGFNIVNLSELNNDYEVNYVSLVDAPDVPKAKFASIKSKDQKTIGKDSDVVQKYAELSGTLDQQLRERKDAVEEAIRTTFMDVEHVWISGIFETEAVANVETQEGSGYYRIPYEYDSENESAEITGGAEEVEIQKVVVAKGQQIKRALEVVNKYQEVAAKEGRVISEENKSKLEKAKEELAEALASIDELLQISTKTKEGEEMDKEEIQQVVKSTLEEVDIETTVKEEVSKFLEEQSTDDNSTDEAAEEGTTKKDGDVEEKEEDSNQELEELEAKVEELEEKVSPKSKSIDGQDAVFKNNDGEEKSFNEYLGRDAMGRKVNK
ncbi:XkdF-like putative serine protease domain-containing protein [Sporohalobacter salinus]|uniref:XkdF-like putative serine protease domain-containing protein n=1 Tax=Sporohalobacter salinus TaxID=1494606 RepID=UPI00195FD8FD|nr:XkdF-like putative serine protease domain-containing protein [Sporohalobacter salinus]MBM7623725.1 hypothetical protein [Sporohalobacter salinus]